MYHCKLFPMPGALSFLTYLSLTTTCKVFPDGSSVKNLPAMQESLVQNPLEEEMATHSSILTWRIPWTEEPGRLQSMGSQKVGHD